MNQVVENKIIKSLTFEKNIRPSISETPRDMGGSYHFTKREREIN